MTDYEKLGVFYLGREFDRARGETTETPVLYDSRDLTTHAVCVGMTGSGKTGLCIALLEEAALDGIPALVIDPKGDMGNLLLTFPELAAQDFERWIDPADAARKDLSVSALAVQTADTWRKGLADWDQEPARIARFREAVDVSIYTPGSTAGLPLSVLRSFAPPIEGNDVDPAAVRDRISSLVSGLLALLAIDADPLKSREHILLSSIVDAAWAEGRALDLASLIAAVQKPAFDKVGVFDLETFFPAKDRVQLALALNTLIAAPGFAAWTQGEALDVQRLLHAPAGKPRISVISIAHLNDAERMFCVTLLLNEVVAWMRRQAGSSSLRALVYMDEIFGYFPPNAMPPAKLPMLTLLKQARAFGVGVVLATQNPVDLDYRGLGNAGTWFIGRLQTERDKLRLREGLQGVLPGATANDGATFDELLSSLSSRVFLMRNVHDDAPVLMKSRWALSYLRGPLTLKEIGTLKAGRSEALESDGARPSASAIPDTGAAAPVVPAGIAQYFERSARGQAIEYRPMIAGFVRLHFIDTKAGVDSWQEVVHVAPFDAEGRDVDWNAARADTDLKARTDREPVPGSRFQPLPAVAMRAASYTAWGKALTAHLHQHAVLDVFTCDELDLAGRPGESEGDFRARLAHALRERRDAKIAELRTKYAARVQTIQDQIRRSSDRVAREQAQYSQQKMQSAISIGAAVLGAVFGGRRSSASIGRAAGALRTSGRLGREKDDVARAEESREVLQQRLEALEAECEAHVAELRRALDPATIAVRTERVNARKSDIAVDSVALLWVVSGID